MLALIKQTKKFSLVIVFVQFVGIQSSSPATQKSLTRHIDKSAGTGEQFRRLRRAGVGGTIAGDIGAYGIALDLNFVPKWSFTAGFGGGPRYQAFSIKVKRYMGGKHLVPYFGGGYARWASVKDEGKIYEESTPGYVVETFLSEEQRETGRFALNLIYPTVGVQYYRLKGGWSGISAYLEIIVLAELFDFDATATGALGLMYYF